MTIAEMILIAFGVSLDAFSVSVSGGMIYPARPWRNGLLAALFFGFFQFVMPIIGGAAGIKFGKLIKEADHYLAFALLFAVGVKMIYESCKPAPSLCGKNEKECNPFAIKSLFVLGIATSIDAAAVGASITLAGNGFYDTLIPASILMGIATALFSFFGVWIGRLFGTILGNKTGIVGGVVLIVIGFKILISHLMA